MLSCFGMSTILKEWNYQNFYGVEFFLEWAKIPIPNVIA